MSRKGDCYDNAAAESLWSRLKAELEIPRAGYNNLQEIKEIVFDYIEGYYNPIRLHSALGYQSPNKFEISFYKKVS